MTFCIAQMVAAEASITIAYIKWKKNCKKLMKVTLKGLAYFTCR